MKKILLGLCLTFGAMPLFSQTTSFIEVNNTDPTTLDATQSVIYSKVANNSIYSDIHLVTVSILEEMMSEEGIIKVSLPFLPDNIPTEIPFTLTNFSFTDFDNYQFGGTHYNQEPSDTYGYSNFLLLKNDGKFIGHFTFEGESYELYDLTGGIQVLVHTSLAMDEDQVECASDGTPNYPQEAAASSCTDRVIKVLVLYSSAANGIEPNMAGKAAACIADLNTIWNNSAIGNNVSLAGVQAIPISFSESNNISNDLNSLSGNSTIQALRVSNNAEIVVFLVDATSYPGVFGMAKEIGAQSANCFAMVDVAQATTGRHTFAHEVSHLFGACHDTDPTANNTHGHTFVTGASWPYCCTGITRKTLMCVIGSGQSRIDHISNQNVTFMNIPTGNPFHNNAEEAVQPFQNIIGPYMNDVNNPVLQVVRIDCASNQLYWDARIDGFCPSPNNGPYTYQWRSLPVINIFVALFTQNTSWLTWANQPSGSPTWITITQPWQVVECVIKDASNNVVFTGYKTIYGIDANGNCVTYRTANPNGEQTAINALGDIPNSGVTIAPNPNNGNFNILAELNEGNAEISVQDVLGKVIINQNVTIGSDKKISNFDCGKLASGVYLISVKKDDVTRTARVLVSE